MAAEWRSRFRSSLAFTVPVFTIMKIMPMFAATRGIVDYEVHKGLPLGPLLCLFLKKAGRRGMGATTGSSTAIVGDRKGRRQHRSRLALLRRLRHPAIIMGEEIE